MTVNPEDPAVVACKLIADNIELSQVETELYIEAYAPFIRKAYEDVVSKAEDLLMVTPTTADMNMLIIAVGGVSAAAQAAKSRYLVLDKNRHALARVLAKTKVSK